MPDETFSPVAASRRLLREAATGALATLDPSGHPFASFVTVATSAAGEPVLLLSGLAAHTRNLLRDPRASVLVTAAGAIGGGDPLAGARLTVIGEVRPDPDAALRRRFLAVHPEAAGYADFRDFAFYRLEVSAAHLVAGFGRINAIAGADLLIDLAGSEDLVANEEGIVGHMNEDHADAVRLYATRLLGAPDGAWRITGSDPEGLDLACGPERRRLTYPRLVRGPGVLRQVLKELAATARATEPRAA